MTIPYLVLREILHNKLSFVLGVLSVVVAVGSVVAALTLLQQHDHRTEELIEAKEAETKEKMAKLEDESRKITKNMGFNLQIVPKGQILDPYSEAYGARTMPADYSERFINANPKIVTVNHVLPVLEERLELEHAGVKKTIFLIGIRGEVFIQDRKQKPIMEAVPSGKVILGKELAASLQLSPDKEIELRGRKFPIHALQPTRDEKDKHSVWMDLTTAQELLGKTGRINGLLALECGCEADRLDKIKDEIGKLLPDTEVYQSSSKANTRAEVRTLAKQTSEVAIEQEKASRGKLRGEREAMAAVLVPLVLLGSAIWIGFLTFAAVQERRVEIAVLRAIGLRSYQILGMFMGNIALMGLVGGLLGCGIGVMAGSLSQSEGGNLRLSSMAFDAKTAVVVFVSAPLLACLAAWLPALVAVRQDPATILSEE